MISAQSSTVIARPIEDVFRFISVDFFKNYPKWSPEVEALEQTSVGPVKVGTTGRQVRRDQGYRTESTFRVTRYEPGRCFSCDGISQPPFRVIYNFEPLHQATKITFTFQLLEVDLFMRPFKKLIEMAIRGGTEKTVRNLKGLLEEEKNDIVCH